MKHLWILVIPLLMVSCGGEVVPKPEGLLRLEYPAPVYKKVQGDCPYSFEMNRLAHLVPKDSCWINLQYPSMKATIYLSYMPVRNNIDSLLRDAQKLAYNHVQKAQGIPEQPFVNPDDNVYGMFYSVLGDAASQSQFYVTDSTKHFLTGSLYFYAKPNYDSIYPAAVYLQKDIRHIMETFSWQE